MLPLKVRGRGRIAASLAASLGMVAAAGAVTTGPAQSVPPIGDCPTAFPVADLVEDQLVEGLTVTRGTTPTEFTGSVIGVKESGIAPGLDMIMMKLTSAEIDRVGGIWQGMSGSPVYTTTGELIGAVAYGLSWGSSPVAGITPYEEMDNYLPAGPAAASPARQVEIGSSDASRIADETDVTQRQAAQGFSWLATPKTFSGVPSWLLDRAATQVPPQGKARPYVAKNAKAVDMVGSATAADASTLVAGGNLGATFAYGDVTSGGVGTVTSVCDGSLVGFGHPMTFSGTTTLSMHPANALYVQEDPLGTPFKVADIGEPAGTITNDRMSGISGPIGDLPVTMDVTSTLSYLERTNELTSHVSLPGANAETTFYEQLVNHDRVLDAIAGGSELQKWTITGTNHGAPFKVSRTDRFSSGSDIAFESPWDVADAVWALSSMPGVVVDDVTINGDLVDDSSTWRVTRLQQNRGGRWVTLDRRHPAFGQAGGTLHVRAVLEDSTDATTVPLAIRIPTRARGTSGVVFVGGGGSSWFNAGRANSVAQLKNSLSTMARNDAVEVQLLLEGRRAMFEDRDVSAATDRVVRGQRLATVVVR